MSRSLAGGKPTNVYGVPTTRVCACGHRDGRHNLQNRCLVAGCRCRHYQSVPDRRYRAAHLPRCQDCHRRFDPHPDAPGGQGGIAGEMHNHPAIPNGTPFAFCDACLRSEGYACTVHTPKRPLRERRADAAKAQAETQALHQRGQWRVLKGAKA